MYRELELIDLMKYQLAHGVKLSQVNLEWCRKIQYREYWIKHHIDDARTDLEIWSGGKEPQLQGIASSVPSAMAFIDHLYVNMFL